MSYATLQQLTERFGARMLVSLTDRADVPTGEIDADVVARALADTDALIDGFVWKKYVLPMAVTPPLLADIAATVAIYKLHPYEPDPKIKADYETALRQLQQIATGTIGLPVAGLEPETQGGSGAQITDREPTLTQDNMTGFI